MCYRRLHTSAVSTAVRLSLWYRRLYFSIVNSCRNILVLCKAVCFSCFSIHRKTLVIHKTLSLSLSLSLSLENPCGPLDYTPLPLLLMTVYIRTSVQRDAGRV